MQVSTIDVVRAERPMVRLAHGGSQTGRVYADFVIDGIPFSTRVAHIGDLISRLGWGSHGTQDAALAALLLQTPADLSDNRRSLYVCPECGDLNCGALTAVVERDGDFVVWRDFLFTADLDTWAPQAYPALGPYRFRWSEYESTMKAGHGIDGFDAEGKRPRRRPWWQRRLPG